MTKQPKTKQKYPHQRVEQRRNKTDVKGMKERSQMEQQSTTRISIGTLTLFKPKPDTEISTFTLAFDKPIPRNELYPKLHEAFDGNWNGDPVKSIFIHLTNPMPMKEIRKRLRVGLEETLTQNL